MNGEWKAISPCPACGNSNATGWCTESLSSGNVCCGRAQSDHELPDGRWLHRPSGNDPNRAAYHGRIVFISSSDPRDDIAAMNDAYMEAVYPFQIEELAGRLGVTAESLNRLGVGRAHDFQVRKGRMHEVFDAGDVFRECGNKIWSFPMRDAAGKICGIKTRRDDGDKRSVGGSKEGLFIPSDLHDVGELMVCEGVTDCAAMLSFGFNAIGRANCTGGRQIVVDFVRRRNFNSVTIMADTNAHEQFGAERLSHSLRLLMDNVRVVTPPAKDARAWRIAGATRADVQAAIDAAPGVGIHVDVIASDEIYAEQSEVVLV